MRIRATDRGGSATAVNGPEATTAQLRPALQFALDHARAGASRPLPGKVRSLVRARRQAPNWAGTMRQALEEDEAFRRWVAADADEEELGRLAWLWLVRPEGWSDELAGLVETAVLEAEQVKEKAAAQERITSLEREAERARQELQAMASSIQSVRGELEEVRKDRARLERRLAAAESARDAAAARAIDAEARLAAAGADKARLTEAVEALQARLDASDLARSGAEEVARRAAGRAAEAEAETRRLADERQAQLDESARRQSSVAAAVARAGAAASELGLALAEAAADLVPSEAPVLEEARRAAEPTPTVTPARRRGSASRRPLPLPPATFADSPEAAGHLVRAHDVHLIVDGYNVTFTSWAAREASGRNLPELRHRLVSALSELALRVKLPVTVVFDGTDAGGRVAAPAPSRPWLRIQFSPSVKEADDVIVETVAGLPAETPVVVASDDRELRERVRAHGANVIGVGQLLSVLGRQPDRPG